MFWLPKKWMPLPLNIQRTLGYHRLYSLHQGTGTYAGAPNSIANGETTPRTSVTGTHTGKMIDSGTSALLAIQKLLDAPYIFVDGEGQHKQSFDPPSTGLSILQIGMPGASEIFIFDMIALLRTTQAASITRLLDKLLSSKTVLKIGWGGREDLKLLKMGHGLSVVPFLDLQVVDIHTRLIGREGYEEKVKRLTSVNFPSREVRKLQVDGIHALSRMDDALLEHQINAPLKERHKGSWLRRPLLLSDINYATNDIVRISCLWDHFKSANLLRSRLMTDMIIQSTAFMHIAGCPQRGRLSAPSMLPMGVLGLTAHDAGSSAAAGSFSRNRDVRKCRRCLRTLDIDSFPFSYPGVVVDGVFQGDRCGPRGEMCRVCAFVSAREHFEIRGAVQKALDFMSGKKLI